MRPHAPPGPRIKIASPSFSFNDALRRETLARFPDAIFHDRKSHLSGAALADYLRDAEGAVIGLERVDAGLLDRCPDLRIIAKYGVGLDNIDIAACNDRGIAIGWTGGVNRRSVAELALCLMLGLSRRVFQSSTLLRAGIWNRDGGSQLSGKTIGIIGLGFTGREVARLLAPFHCRVLGNDILPMNAWCRENGVIPADKATILAEADIITLHVPTTAATSRLINAGSLRRMKPTAMLINTSRGEIVDQAALKRALMDRTIAAAALDVFEIEPPDDLEFLALPNLVATAHIGGGALEAILAMGRSAIEHLCQFFPAQQHEGQGAALDPPGPGAPDPFYKAEAAFGTPALASASA